MIRSTFLPGWKSSLHWILLFLNSIDRFWVFEPGPSSVAVLWRNNKYLSLVRTRNMQKRPWLSNAVFNICQVFGSRIMTKKRINSYCILDTRSQNIGYFSFLSHFEFTTLNSTPFRIHCWVWCKQYLIWIPL